MLFLNNVNPFIKFFKIFDFKHSAHIFKKHKKLNFNLKLNHNHPVEKLMDHQIEILKTIYEKRDIRNPKADLLNNRYYDDYLFLTRNEDSYNNIILDRFFTKYGSLMFKYLSKVRHLNTSNRILNVNFLRKERLYTKLKYSRSPAYDIVSGGSAALLAAFLGFLISEKYGFELVDSGDFYYLFMYIVFLSFSIRPIVYTVNASESWIKIVSFKSITSFLSNLLQVALNKVKRLFTPFII